MKTNPSPTKIRELVIQALYQKKISGDSNTKILKELKQAQKNLNTEKVSQIVKDIKLFEQEFSNTIEKLSNIPFERIGGIELSILYLALYEVSKSQLDIPIIINEAVKLAKKFGQSSSHKFINAILDKAIKEKQII
ncbi:MAG: transcription antitermination factor NusB [Gammaproteobacteria bacterium]|nr:transcription antitermination factor NusB [Gammaproteobacteria bacterium]